MHIELFDLLWLFVAVLIFQYVVCISALFWTSIVIYLSLGNLLVLNRLYIFLSLRNPCFWNHSFKSNLPWFFPWHIHFISSSLSLWNPFSRFATRSINIRRHRILIHLCTLLKFNLLYLLMAVVSLVLQSLSLDIHVKDWGRVCIEHVVWTLIDDEILLRIVIIQTYVVLFQGFDIAKFDFNDLIVDSCWRPVLLLLLLLLRQFVITLCRVHTILYFEVNNRAYWWLNCHTLSHAQLWQC